MHSNQVAGNSLKTEKSEWIKHCNNMSRSVVKHFRRGEGRKEDMRGKRLVRKSVDLRENEETGGSRPFAVFLG